MGPGTVVTAPVIARFDGEPVSQPIGPSAAAFFSLAVIGRRFLVGLASDAVSGTGVAAAAGRRGEERRCFQSCTSRFCCAAIPCASRPPQENPRSFPPQTVTDAAASRDTDPHT